MKIANEVIDVLKTVEVDDNAIRITAQLDRKLYQDTAKVLKAMGGKWVSAKKATVFPQGSDIENTLAEICAKGEFTSLAKQFQYFPTPDGLAAQLAVIADVKPSDICLEPSAGRGNIAKYLPNCDCIELNEDNRKCLIENGFQVIYDDFMTFVPEKKYDVIVMNPPFCKAQDAKHIIKAIQIADRTVVAICGSGILYRKDKIYSELRDLVKKYGGTIEKLPEKSFAESGTAVKTCLIVVHKSSRDTEVKNDEQIY